MSKEDKDEILRLFHQRAKGVRSTKWYETIDKEFERRFGPGYINGPSSKELRYLREKYEGELKKRGEPSVKPEHYAAVLDRQNLVEVGYLRKLWREELQNPYRAYPIEDLFIDFKRIPDPK